MIFNKYRFTLIQSHDTHKEHIFEVYILKVILSITVLMNHFSSFFSSIFFSLEQKLLSGEINGCLIIHNILA